MASTMPPRRGLGQGLSILLGDAQIAGDGRLREIPVARVSPNPRQPRSRMDEKEFGELVASVRRDGVLQPILVRAIGDGWELIAGERRWRAAAAANLVTIPALVRMADERESLALAIVENVVRSDLNAIEAARAYARLVDEFAATHAEIAEAVGRSRVAVSNSLRLLSLPDDVITRIERGELSEGHGRALLQLEDHEQRSAVARRAIEGGWTVRRTEAAARGSAPVRPRRHVPSGPSWYDVELANDAIDGVYRTFGLPARVTSSGDACTLEITLATADALAQLVARLGSLEPRAV